MIHSTNEFVQPRATVPVRVYASDFERRVTQLMQILADIDFAFELEIEKLSLRDEEKVGFASRIAALKEAHRLRRDPYAQRLAELHTREAGLSAVRQAGAFLFAPPAARTAG